MLLAEGQEDGFLDKEDFHITVMDVLKGELGRTVPANINEYINYNK